MQPLVWALWSLVGVFGATAHAGSTMEVDLVFPRNETYTTDIQMPVVFSIRNAHLGPLLKPSIYYQIYNSDLGQSMPLHHHQFPNASWTNHEPYFVYTFIHMTMEGSYRVLWITSWAHCNDNGEKTKLISDDKTILLDFTIKKDTPATDLLALTRPSNDKSCSASPGVAINIANETIIAPSPHDGNCAVMNAVKPVDASSNPCQVGIDEATAERIQASMQNRLCSGRISNPPDDCPIKDDEDNAAQSGAVPGLGRLAAVVGAIGLLLAQDGV